MGEKIQYRRLVKERREKLFKEGNVPAEAEEIMLSLIRPEIVEGYWWGPWKLEGRDALFCYDPEGKSINPLFWINLENMNCSAEVLNCVFGVIAKAWATPDVISNLVWALEDILSPRQNICPGGSDVPFNVLAHLAGIKEASD